MIQYLKRFFTYEGRIGRKQYLIDLGASLLMNFLIFGTVFGVANLVFGLSYFDFIFKLRPVTAVVGLTIFFFPAVKRMHDVGWPGWVFSAFVIVQVSGLMMTIDAEGRRFVFEAMNAFEMQWMLFMAGLYFIVFIISFVLLFKKGIEGSNAYGSNPLAQ
ncbi:MAG: DUF805 domain-containing protein [Bdellovibrionales bacterium]|nr:DUF805 domain-containing protein [Bdellovibrionales bacterium]